MHKIQKRNLFLFTLLILVLVGITSTRIIELNKPILKTEKYPTPLAYNGNGSVKLFNFKTNSEIDLGIKDYATQFLWSKQGKLVVLTQGAYGSTNLLTVPQVYATTEGFYYLAYLVDLNDNKPTLLVPQLFGDIFWSKDGSGLYVSEEYYQGKPLLMGNQSGMSPDMVKAFFVDLTGKKTQVDITEFNQMKQLANQHNSPDGVYTINENNYPFDTIIELTTGKEFLIKPEAYYTSTRHSQWSPDGKNIAMLYEVDSKVSSHSFLRTTPLNDVIQKSNTLKQTLAVSAEIIGFSWIDNEKLLVQQIQYFSQPGNYKGNIGIIDVNKQTYKEIVPVISTRSLRSDMHISPDQQYFTYEKVNDQDKGEIVILKLDGTIVKTLSGSSPSWMPAPISK